MSRTVIITGASRGIGLEVARVLVEQGANVVITARKRELLEAAADSLGARARVLAVSGNSADARHRTAAVAAALDQFGSIDALVNNTGINPQYGPLVTAELDTVSKVLETNLVATLGWIQEAHKHWMAAHGGVIVNVASAAGLRAAPNIGAYAMSKAALVQLTQQLAVELGPSVRVNAVAPAVVRTSFAKRLYEDEADVSSRYPLGRIGDPDDVAQAVAFLLSEHASWISGHTLLVDGGLLAGGGI